ncbi:facilitated trehalose transporter Tret1-like [Schistocerca piceifrons]|uniref:facilitated trehalose transporter Tret1-like n=1 Tax=Schistocerca piceifrons TaxID=274613 RepID=UPI001F5E3D1E|nr:facilitated trehalose transporter Tret1-like [Schistocerca piceifrons]
MLNDDGVFFFPSASLAYASHGSFSGWSGTTVPILQSEDSPIPLTADEGSWLASVNSLTMPVSIFATGYLVDVLGRKKLLLLSAVPLLAWWVMVAFADSFGMLLAGRIVGSLGGGIVLTVIPMYLGEIADTDIRGTSVAIHSVLLQGGSLFSYCIGPYVSVTTAAIICCSLPILFVITFIWMPESPYFFLIRDREQEAVKSLTRLKGQLDPQELDSELVEMRKTLRRKQETKGKLKDVLVVPVHRRTLLLMIGFIVLRMSSGSVAFSAYTTQIFERSGSGLDADISSIILVSVQLLASLGASLIIDRIGRRTLCIVSFVLCAVCLAAEGAYFYLDELQGDVDAALDWVPLAAMIGYHFSYDIGAGAVLYPLIGEIYHLSVKAVATSINTTIVSLYGFFLKKMFQVVSDSVGAYWSFWGFAVLNLCATLYTYFLMPETKGKTFAQINEEMDARVNRRTARVPTRTEKSALG